MVLDIILFTSLAVSLYTDLKYKKIYNKILFPALLSALLYHVVFGGLPELKNSLQGLFMGMAFLFIPFAMGGIGAGDVKLMGLIGACKGTAFVWPAFLATALAGGLIALYILIRQKRLSRTLMGLKYTLLTLMGLLPRDNPFTNGTMVTAPTTFPYGTAITAGTIVAYFLR